MDRANFSFVDVSERDMDFLFAEELECDPTFRAWFLGRTGGSEGKGGLLRVGRSISTAQGETDLLMVHATANGSRRAVMIENKVAAPFMRLQPERYRLRGEKGVEHGDWDEFATVLIAPLRRLEGVPAGTFDHHVSYEECEAALGGSNARVDFKRRVLRAACGKARVPWIASIDVAVTAWFKAARRFGVMEFPDLPLAAEGRGRPATSTWLVFRLRAFPQSRVLIEIKPMNGVVDLRFTDVAIGEMRRTLTSLPDGADTVAATSGKSVSIRFSHPPATLANPFPGQEETLRPMLASADKLLRYAATHEAKILAMLGY